MTPRLDCRWLLICALVSLLGTAHAGDGVILVQESNGFPGGEKAGAQKSRQQVAVQGSRLRVLDNAHNWALFIDLDAHRVQEAAVDLEQYVERSFDYYGKYRNDRKRNLAKQARSWAKKAKRLADDGDTRKLEKWREEYRRAGGDPDEPGKIVAELKKLPETETVTILVDRKETEIVLEHYVIRENQAEAPIFDLWTTQSVKLPSDMFRFYREIGTFSPEVSAKLKEVIGTVIRCTAVLDTGSLQRKFVSKVIEVRLAEGVRGFMEAPKTWSRRDPDAAPAGPPVEAAAARPCDVCGKAIEGQPLKYRPPSSYKGKRALYACSNEHRVKLIAKVRAELKKQKGK